MLEKKIVLKISQLCSSYGYLKHLINLKTIQHTNTAYLTNTTNLVTNFFLNLHLYY